MPMYGACGGMDGRGDEHRLGGGPRSTKMSTMSTLLRYDEAHRMPEMGFSNATEQRFRRRFLEVG